jgi:hypothetical protein
MTAVRKRVRKKSMRREEHVPLEQASGKRESTSQARLVVGPKSWRGGRGSQPLPNATWRQLGPTGWLKPRRAIFQPPLQVGRRRRPPGRAALWTSSRALTRPCSPASLATAGTAAYRDQLGSERRPRRQGLPARRHPASQQPPASLPPATRTRLATRVACRAVQWRRPAE